MRTLFLAVLGLAAPAARADIVYDQDLPAGATPPAFAISDPSRSQIAADDFALTAAATVTDVRWYGRTGVTAIDPVGPATFRIEFLSDGFGPIPLPGSVVSSQTVDVGRTDVGTTAPLYAYAAALPTPVALAPGRYWLSIAEVDADTPNVWSWAIASQKPGEFLDVRRDDTAAWTLTDGAAAFTLEGTTTPVDVPAPPAILLAGIGAAGFWGVRRRAQPVAERRV
ncbi:hypothetical protein [Limnoglobus roseus]|uniref:PEP-CTERM sorting domain-containing protein n=1 Tax=Limnoglobus roseus TaxID=2598579 RepID=A0A5C1ACL3_9BACT|nr:hypothetical protein [Limnoglobus roseus]QEL15877.1 hypothetical protein PX52LOC_02813 [Limnoglobus roseus]